MGARGHFSGWSDTAGSESAPEACREPQERLSKWPGLCWDRPGPTCLRSPSDTFPRVGTAAAAGREVAMVTGDSLHPPHPAGRLPASSPPAASGPLCRTAFPLAASMQKQVLS